MLGRRIQFPHYVNQRPTNTSTFQFCLLQVIESKNKLTSFVHQQQLSKQMVGSHRFWLCKKNVVWVSTLFFAKPCFIGWAYEFARPNANLDRFSWNHWQHLDFFLDCQQWWKKFEISMFDIRSLRSIKCAMDMWSEHLSTRHNPDQLQNLSWPMQQPNEQTIHSKLVCQYAKLNIFNQKIATWLHETYSYRLLHWLVCIGIHEVANRGVFRIQKNVATSRHHLTGCKWWQVVPNNKWPQVATNGYR